MPYYPPASTGSGSNTPADNVFRIQDNGDATKQIAFEASTVATGTTRTATMPNADGTLTLLGNASTGSGNVVLDTSPTIVTPTISATGWTNANHNHAAANSGGVLLPDPAGMVLQDEFLGGSTTNGFIGELGWLTNLNGGSHAAQTTVAGIATHPGYIKSSSGASSGNYASAFLDISNGDDIASCSFIIQAIDITSNRIQVGLGSATNHAANPAIMVEFDSASADTNWMLVQTGGSGAARTSSGVPIVAGVWVRADFTRTASNVWSSTVTRLDTSATATRTLMNFTPSTSTFITWGVKTNTTVTKSMYMDWFRVSYAGITRV